MTSDLPGEIPYQSSDDPDTPPPEEDFNPKPAEHESLARVEHSGSQIDLVTPSSPNGKDPDPGASASDSQMPVGGF